MIKVNLAVKMAERKIKINELSNRSGISRPTLTSLYYERSKGIEFDTLERLCRALDIPIEEIITIVNSNQK